MYDITVPFPHELFKRTFGLINSLIFQVHDIKESFYGQVGLIVYWGAIPFCTLKQCKPILLSFTEAY